MIGSSRIEIAALAQVALFAGLDQNALEDIYSCGQTQRIPRDRVLFRQQAPARLLYVLLEGRIRVSELTPDGHEVLLRFIEPGQMLGGMAALGDMAYLVTARAQIPSRVQTWAHPALERLMTRYPRLARNAMRLMVKRIDELQKRCVELATERVEQRIARAVLRLAAQAGKRTEQGVLLNLPLSRQDLAALTGTTLFTVSRVLNRWSQQGVLSLGRQRVTLRRPHELVVIAEALRG